MLLEESWVSTILIIDDDSAFLTSVSQQLEEAGFATMRANTVRMAEITIGERSVDLALLDPDIENGDGWILLKTIAPIQPVIVISGRGLEEDIVAGLESGAADYLTKPFRSGELVARIRVHLRNWRSAAPTLPTTTASTNTTAHLDPQVVSAVEIRTPANPTPPDPRQIVRPSQVLGEGDDEQVFISVAEEQRMISAREQSNNAPLHDIGHLPLGERLRAARQRRRITLVQAELDTRLRMHYLQAMEDEKFALLPRGHMTEELLDTYVTYLGLDRSQALDEYRRLHYSAPMTPPNALGGSPLPRRIPSWIGPVLAAILALVIGLGGIAFFNPQFFPDLADRAWGLMAAPTATVEPTATTAPTAEPTATPTITPTPSATTEPTLTPIILSTPVGTPDTPPTATPTN
jgi:CheY-like chemotaxis protein